MGNDPQAKAHPDFNERLGLLPAIDAWIGNRKAGFRLQIICLPQFTFTGRNDGAPTFISADQRKRADLQSLTSLGRGKSAGCILGRI